MQVYQQFLVSRDFQRWMSRKQQPRLLQRAGYSVSAVFFAVIERAPDPVNSHLMSARVDPYLSLLFLILLKKVVIKMVIVILLYRLFFLRLGAPQVIL